MANLSEVMDHNMRARSASKSKPVLDHIKVSETENGGHMVEHVMRGGEAPIAAHGANMHAFSHDERKAMVPEGSVLHHIAKHMNVPHEVSDAERGMEEAEE
jgi:hypothetical protein